MTTALDTNVLLDVLVPGSPHGDESQQALDAAVADSGLVISEPVYAELGARFVHLHELDAFLVTTRVQLERSTRTTLHAAGRAWNEYSRRRPVAIECPECGAPQPERCAQCGGRNQARQRV